MNEIKRLSELAARILSELEEAGAENFSSTVNTVMDPLGEKAEIDDSVNALKELIQSGLAGLRSCVLSTSQRNRLMYRLKCYRNWSQASVLRPKSVYGNGMKSCLWLRSSQRRRGESLRSRFLTSVAISGGGRTVVRKVASDVASILV